MGIFLRIDPAPGMFHTACVLKRATFPRSFRCILCLTSVFALGVLPVGAGAIGSKTARPAQGHPIFASSQEESTAETKPKVHSPSKADDESLPKAENMSKEAEGERNPFLRQIDQSEGHAFSQQQSSVNAIADQAAAETGPFKARSFSPQNSDALKFFNRQSSLDKESNWSQKSSALSQREFGTSSFRFRSKPGLPELDMPPPAYFENKSTSLTQRDTSFAARKARGFDRSSRPKAYLGPEAKRAQEDVAQINTALFQSSKTSPDGEVDLDRLPDRPLSIGEVKALLNQHGSN